MHVVGRPGFGFQIRALAFERSTSEGRTGRPPGDVKISSKLSTNLGRCSPVSKKSFLSEAPPTPRLQPVAGVGPAPNLGAQYKFGTLAVQSAKIRRFHCGLTLFQIWTPPSGLPNLDMLISGRSPVGNQWRLQSQKSEHPISTRACASIWRTTLLYVLYTVCTVCVARSPP